MLIGQNNEIYLLKKEMNLLSYQDPQLVIEKGNELERKLHYRWLMIAGEGMVFMVLLAIAFIRVRNTFRKEAELAAQQKNFLLSVTHELKSPIASARLQLETMRLRKLDESRQMELLSAALADTDRLNNLVENLLLAARIDNSSYELHLEATDLAPLTEGILARAGQTLAPGLKIEAELEPATRAMVDKNAFPSILLNLIENAAKYAGEQPMIKVILKKREQRVFLSVSDQGLGIPDEEKQNIFKKFYRIGSEETRRSKGTGLGLYIVRYLVESHRGTITVKDNKPSGTSFEIVLPAL